MSRLYFMEFSSMKNGDRAAAVKVLSAIRISVPVIKGTQGEKT